MLEIELVFLSFRKVCHHNGTNNTNAGNGIRYYELQELLVILIVPGGFDGKE